MRLQRWLSLFALTVLTLGFRAASAGAAVTITRSELNGTQLRVEGGGALPNHSISINPGGVMGTTDGAGDFKVETSPYSSSTCRITVSDGTTSAAATLAGCTPSSPPPPPPAGIPAASLSPTALTFATQNTGTTSAAQTITAGNSGSAPLTVTGATLGGANPGDYLKTADSCSGVTVAAGSSCTVSVAFRPVATGTRTARLALTDNASNSPQTVSISGTGGATAPPPPPPPPSGQVLSTLTLNPTTVAGGNSSTGTVTLSAPASAATTVTLSSSNVNVAGPPQSVTVPAGANSASFTIVTPFAVPASTNVTITASLGAVTKSAVLTVTGAALQINTGGLTCSNGVCQLGPGNVGTFFNQAISSGGGTGPTPFQWTLVAGRVPDGLTLNDPRLCGVHCVTISGTPQTVQTTTFTIQVQDGAGATAQQAFSLSINGPRPLVVTTPSNCCPAGTVGTSYSIHFFADGGVLPYRWSLVSGQFPPGLQLDQSGLLSGTPTTRGTFTFTVQVTDNAGLQATGGPFSITIS